MFKSNLSEEELTHFSSIHKKFIPKRKKRFETYDIYYKQEKPISINPILEKAYSILDTYNNKNYDKNKYIVEFHQRNCGFEKKKYDCSDWHIDDFAAFNCRVYTILFYLRKDKTIDGGDLEYILDGNKFIHNVKNGDILHFSGNIKHKPQATGGFGCRDIIVVFIKRTDNEIKNKK